MFEELGKNYHPNNKGKVIALQELIIRLKADNKKYTSRDIKTSNNVRIALAEIKLQQLTY